MATFTRSLFALLCIVSGAAVRADEPRISNPHFLGAQSCMSTSCHGGGEHGVLTKDVHLLSYSKLGNAKSQNYAEALHLVDPKLSARCTVCHSPMQGLPLSRLAKNARVEPGVRCENCHGPGENYLLSHTRPDYTHEQRVAVGIRPTRDLYNRVNVCIACHHMIDSDLTSIAGHPELFFEFDRQMAAQPPHWKDDGPWFGPRAWLTGQAAALRELSWKLTKANDPQLLARWRGLIWLLRQTEPGASLPQTDDFAAMQSASDRLTRAATRQDWSKASTLQLFKHYATLSDQFRDPKTDPIDLRRRGEVLRLALDRLWAALKTDAKLSSENLDQALSILAGEAVKREGFDPAMFAAALQSVEVAVELLPKS